MLLNAVSSDSTLREILRSSDSDIEKAMELYQALLALINDEFCQFATSEDADPAEWKCGHV